MKKGKSQKKSPAKLKKELDKIFSLYIRQKYADKKGQATCYTCGNIKDWREMQNGHFVSRGYLATRYSEDNCRVQCVGCNVFGGGRTAIFATKLDTELGKGTTARLYREAQRIVKDFPYETLLQKYRALITNDVIR